MSLYTAAVQQLYVAYFSRPADAAGLVYWEGVIAAAKGDTSSVSAAFAASTEYRAAYAGKDSAQTIDTVYLNLFGRLPEAAGSQYWAPLLQSGKVTIDNVVTAVAGGAQASDLAAYKAKVTAATAFSAALDTTPEMLGYSGAAGNAAGIAFLASVKDAATLAAAIEPTKLILTIAGATGTTPVPVPDPTPNPTPPPTPTPVPPISKGLNINLGAGDDTLGNIAISAGDTVDGGAGIDSLALAQVGAANYSAFWNFERLNASKAGYFDMGMLADHNRISEVLVSGATKPDNLFLINLAAATGLRLTADQASVNVSQAVPGLLSVIADRDETTPPTAAVEVFVTADAATSFKVVFDNDFKLARPLETGANGSFLNGGLVSLKSASAVSASVMSGGDHAINYLSYHDSAASGSLSELTISGSQRLYFISVDTAKLSLVDASTQTGGLYMDTARLGDGGMIRLGSGTDRVTVSASSTPAGLESVAGFEKTAAAATGTNAAAAAAAIADADKLVFAGGAVANAASVEGGVLDAMGVLSFIGAGPATLDAAFAIAELAAESAGEVLVFSYLNDSYVFMQGADLAIKLVGTVGISAIGESGTADNFYIL